MAKKAESPRDTWNAQASKLFLEQLAKGSSVTASARAAGVPRTTVYRWRNENEEFCRGWDDALDAGVDRLEDAALERALGLALEDGRVVFSDKLLEMLLKAKRPEKYRERYDLNHKHEGQTRIVLDFRVVERGPDGELREVVE